MESPVSRIPNAVVLEEILPRLPVKSLLRFQCVSKSWYASISDPKFSLKTKTHRVALVPVTTVADIETLYYVDYKSSSVEQQNLSFLGLEHCFNNVTLLCSYNNGLLLLSYGKSFYLLNPSTRKSSKVFTYPDHLYAQYIFTAGICYGFSTRDYKVVVGIRPTSMRPFCHWQMEWFSIRKKSRGYLYFPCNAELKKFGPVIDDKVYCLATKGKEIIRREREWFYFGHDRICLGPDMIFVFDSEKDELVEVPTPAPELGSKKVIKCLFDLDGYLAMARLGDEAGMDLLVMKQDSWTLLFTFANFNGYSPYNVTPLYITEDGEVLIDIYREKVVAYSTQEDTYRDLFITQVGYEDGILLYRESLICPPASHWMEEERRQRRKTRKMVEDKSSKRL